MVWASLAKASNQKNQTGHVLSEFSRPIVHAGPYAEILALQGAVGNRVVNQVLRSKTDDLVMIQAKLIVDQPRDKYEQEADRAADMIMQMPDPQANAGQQSFAWSIDDLSISFHPLEPTTGQAEYEESGSEHSRMSDNLPYYRGPFCQNSKLPFRCEIGFGVDALNAARPQPFKSPQLKAYFQFSPKGGSGFKFSASDDNPRYLGPGRALQTKFPPFNFTLNENGIFRMKFELYDPDTKITRIYDDQILVEAKRPCV